MINKNWYIKITKENCEYLNSKRGHNITVNEGYYNSHLNDGEHDFWNWTYDLPHGFKEISLEEFKKYVIGETQEKWCVKLTKDNIDTINAFFHKNSFYYKKYKSNWGFVPSDIDSGYYFHFPETSRGYYASSSKEKDHELISNEEFLLKVKGVNVVKDKTYPTSLETVKFKSEPDKCVEKRPDLAYLNFSDFDMISNEEEIHSKLDDLRKRLDNRFGMNYGISRDSLSGEFLEGTIVKNPINFGTKGEIKNHYAKVFEEPFKWNTLADNMLRQRTMYETLNSYPLTPKDCYKNLPDMIYVKKLKTFLKNDNK
jgi:hypothetical protein